MDMEGFSGKKLRKYVVYDAEFKHDEKAGGMVLDYDKNFDWIPCDSYIVFGFSKEGDNGERLSAEVKKKGDNLRADLLPTDFLYNKTFVDIMLTAAEFYAKNDNVMVGMLKQRLGIAN